MAEEARAAAKDATEEQEITQANGPMSYAAAAARGVPLANTYKAQRAKQPSAQTQREVIMNIRDLLTIQSLMAMNPSNLKMHVQRAIEQSGNENIVNVKIVSSNQLKSGDLSIKTASSREVEALRQFADDWAHRIGSGTTVQILTFGVLAHGIRTSTMDMSKLDEIRAQLLQDNRPFIPRTEIRHIGWLTRDAAAKTPRQPTASDVPWRQPWPQQPTWPTPFREHATRLSTYLQDALTCIDRTQSQPVPTDLVKVIIHGTLTFILKVQHAPDLSTVCDALSILQTEAKASTENAARMLDAVKHELKAELKNTADTVHAIAANVQLNTRAGEDAKTAAKEAVEVGKANLQMARQIKNAGPQTGGAASYAAMAARGAPPASITNTQVPRIPPMQTQRDVVVNIRDPTTVLSLRAMNPRNLNAHVERAIAQSGNENISGIKVFSSNQLRSGDLSIRTATSNETEALKQFADDWVNRIGNRASIRVTTYGIIAHSILTSTIDMDRFEETRDQLLLDNKPFTPQAEIKYIGWLTRNAPTKAFSSITIEFSKPEDANKIIDEGLIW
ncbi:hypothetical protein N0V95_010054 [Ascochyta clinopodiicola]|nr:hypothetical protein N0V95_010054 [Ascochyta clinopodiicola]